MSNDDGEKLYASSSDGSITAEQMELIELLRNDLKEQLAAHEHINTDFNLLRWLKGYGFKYDEVCRRLAKHLRMRTLLQLERVAQLDFSDNIIHKHYVPIGWLGEAGINNQFAFLDMAGRCDPGGLIKALQPMNYMLARLKLLNEAMNQMNAMEAKTGKQSGIIYIYDLDGLEMDPSLLFILTGPLRQFWVVISDNTPEMLSKIIVINAPSYMNVLYRAIAPFLPEHTKEKIIITDSHWKETLLEYIAPDRLPEYLGGTRRDKNGDPMCREFITFPPESGKKIPKELYWKPPPGHPEFHDLICVHVPAGTCTFKSVQVKDIDLVIHLYLYCEEEYTLAIHFDANNNGSNEKKVIESYPEYLPCMELPGISGVIDHQRWPLFEKGTYHLRFGNDKAWFRPLSVYVKYVVEKDNETGFAQIT